MPRFCDERKWNAAVANQLMKIGNRINNLTWHKKHAGMKNLTGLSISFHGSVVRPAVNRGARASVWTWGDVALQIRCTASLAISLSWGGGLFLCSLPSFEALMPLICHLSFTSHAVQFTPVHEQDDVTALQPTHSLKGGQACLLEKGRLC